MRVLVCGDRNWAHRYRFVGDEDDHGLLKLGDKGWEDYLYMMEVLDETKLLSGIDKIIQGKARGADQLARFWAHTRGVPFRDFEAHWDLYGNSAGPIRNRLQLKNGKPHLVIAFHRAFHQSKGTADMVKISREAGVKCWCSRIDDSQIQGGRPGCLARNDQCRNHGLSHVG